MEEAGKLAESTAILLNVSEFQDANAASEALISTMQAFGYVAKDSQHVVDILNEVGNNFAVSSDGIATALQDSASALMEAGNNLEQSVALVAAANKVLQDPNSVGSALRTISLRLRGTSVEILEQLGEETDGAVESVSKMQEKLKALTGVDILTDSGAYKDTYTILKEIAEVWDTMDPMNQAAALELMAGKNRANALAAILGNAEDLRDAYESALDAEGSAFKENEAYLDSIQGRIDIFNNSLQTMWMNLLNTNVIKGIVDAGTFLVQLLDTAHGKILAVISALMIYSKIKNKTKFSEMFGGAIDILANMISGTKALTVTTVAEALANKKVNKELITQILIKSQIAGLDGKLTKEKVKLTAATLTEAFKNKELTASQYLATMSSMGLGNALKGLWQVLKANPLILVTAIITVAAVALDAFTTTAQEAADAAHKAFEEIQSVVESTKSTIQSLKSELSTLQDKINEFDGKKLSFAEEKELDKLKAQREELEYSLRTQKQLLEMQQKTSNERAIASMHAYVKAASQGAEKTQKAWKTVGSIAGGVLAAAGIAASVLIPGDFGTIGAGAVAVGSKIATAAGAATIAGGAYFGGKAGELAGSGIAANDGSYDSWYETYSKAIDKATEEEQKAYERYQKDSDNTKKLDKWQEAQQKTSEIETEMYDHLSQMQQYYNGLEYGVSDEQDKELDTWYNFLDKLSIKEGASGAEVTALDRIFGVNASEDIQSLRDKILATIDSGKEFDFTAAVDGCQELKDLLTYIGLDAEDVKDYFVLVGEEAKQIAAYMDSVKSYSVLAESAEKYQGILQQTSEIVADNTKVSQEYKDSLKEIGISEDELNECFDKTAPLVVKNVKALNQLVKAASKNVATNVKLAKSNARLDYYKLIKQLSGTLDGTKELDAATRDSVYSILEQVDAIEQALYKYQLLEDSLLGVNNAFKEFNDAKEIDSLNTYGDSYVEMVQTMYDGLFKTGQVGTEQFWAAVENLVPDEVYQGIKEDSDRMKAIYDYYNKNILPSLHLDDDQLSMDYASVENFVKKAIDVGIFDGDRKDFDLVEGMNLEKAAELMGITKTQAYAFFAELDKYNTSSTEQSFLSQLDDSIEGRITNVTNKIEDLNKQKLALLEDGDYEKNAKAIQDINAQIGTSQTELNKLGQEAYNAWQEYTKIDAALAAIGEVENKQRTLTENEANMLGIEWDAAKEMTVQQAYDQLLAKQLKLEEPTILTATLAIDNINTQIEQLKQKLLEAEQDPTILGVDVNADQTTIDAAKKEIENQIQALEEDKVVIATTFGIELSEQEKQDLMDELNAVETFTIHDKEFTVIANGTSEVIQALQAVNDYAKDVTKTVTTEYNYKGSGGGGAGRLANQLHTAEADGTAHVDGTAYKNGSFGAPQTETALVGELGPEMIVRNGRWTTVGDNGAEFTQVKKGDIIFNHKQTEDLLSKGYVTGRGKLHGGAFASGTAYSGLWRPTSPNTSQSNKPGRDFSTKGNSLYDAADALSSASDSISDSADEFKEVFDWIEVRLEEINEDINLKSAQLENQIGYKNQNDVVNKIIDLNKTLKSNLDAAQGYYETYASRLLSEVDSQYRDLAQNGAIDIDVFKGKIGEKQLKAIQEYRDWVQKAADVTQQAEETITEISSLAKQAIDNIATQFENEASLVENRSNQLDAYNALLETSYGVESEKIYKELIKINNDNKTALQNQINAMQQELDSRVELGEIKKYSQDWYDAVNDIAALDTEIIELTAGINDLQDSINEIHWYHFDLLMSQFESISEEAENLIDILTTKDVVDEMGNWTDEGITALGLYAQQMEVAQKQAEQYANEIDSLNRDWQKLGYTEEEYLDKLDELKSGQYDAIKSYNDTKDAIVDLNKERVDAIKEGIEKEIEAYEELIKVKKEELDADKDLHGFRKSIMEQEKDIADLERRRAALSGNSSASARAERAQLDAEIAEAKANLQESYYDRSISNQQDALDKELENFKEEKDAEIEGWEKYLEETETVVSDSLAIVQANTDAVLQTLNTIGQEYSLNITNSLTSPWKNGSIAISDYQTTFGNAVSETMDMLDKLSSKYNEVNGSLVNEVENKGQEHINSVNTSVSEYGKATEKQVASSNNSGGNTSNNVAVTPSTAGMVSSISGTIYYGQTGDRVKKLQQALNELGYGNSGTSGLDGKFGPKTLAAVKAFQKAMGIAQDGRVGPETKKKFKLKGYAKGSKSINEDQWSILDELGDELRLIPGQNGRLEYVKKGTGIVPSDLTERLIDLAMDPQEMLDRNRPSIGVHPEIHHTEIQIDNSIAELIHIDKCDQSTLPDVEKIVNKALEQHTQRLNQSLRKYAR